MNVIWHGFSCFKIQEQGQGKEVAVVTDPFSPEDGKKLSRALTADVVTVSHDHARHNNVMAVGGEPFVIDGPGEFEVKDVFVTGVPTYHDMVDGKEKGTNTMYYITVGDVHIVHLGDLKHPLEEKHMEEFHNIDILFVPVGGGDVLNAKQAAEVVSQLEPRIIVPMHYKTGGFGEKFDGVEPFLKAMGMSKPEVLPKLKLSAKELPQEETRIILLEPQ
jgi:L-ascorbate metabolism protein UlaG (beta-lactamase superfamily)